MTRPPLSGLRLLVVEDEFLVALDLETMLSDAGAEVTVEATVAGGKARARAAFAGEGAFDCALLDVRLADGDVFPLAMVLCTQGVAVVFHSGHARIEDVQTMFPDAQTLSKPAPEAALIDAVARVRRRAPA